MSLPLSITVKRINIDGRYRICNDGPWPCQRPNTLGELYRSLAKVYGRCTSHVFIDGPDGKPQKVGWVFVKREPYDDVPETFLCETWVTVWKDPPKPIMTPGVVANLDERIAS